MLTNRFAEYTVKRIRCRSNFSLDVQDLGTSLSDIVECQFQGCVGPESYLTGKVHPDPFLTVFQGCEAIYLNPCCRKLSYHAFYICSR